MTLIFSKGKPYLMPKMKVCTENSSLKQLKRVRNTLNKDFSLGQCIKLCKIVCLWKQKGTLLATFYHYIRTHPYLSAFQTCLETSLFRLGINFPSRYPWSILVSSFVIADCNFCSTCATHLMDFTLFKKKKKSRYICNFSKTWVCQFYYTPQCYDLGSNESCSHCPTCTWSVQMWTVDQGFFQYPK